MSRNFTAQQITALQAQHVNLVMFAKLEFPGGATMYVHNGLGTYTTSDSQDWSGLGSLAQVGKVEEGMDVSPYALQLTLSGLDTTLASKALTEDYYLSPVTLYVGLLNDDDELIGDPTEFWAGFMDQMSVSVGNESGDAIQLTCESELSRFDKSRNLMYTNVGQQKRFSGDLFFNHIHLIDGLKINWGANPGDQRGPAGNPQTPGDIKEANEFLRS